jgi:hypothetical protein
VAAAAQTGTKTAVAALKNAAVAVVVQVVATGRAVTGPVLVQAALRKAN